MLDTAYPEHRYCDFVERLSPKFTIAVNPTAIHETYHALVYGQKWSRRDAREKLEALIQHPYAHCINQTKKTSRIALRIAEENNLGGRDSLVVANYLSARITTLYTHDEELTRIKKVKWKQLEITVEDPVK